jgi:hypothetical protein
MKLMLPLLLSSALFAGEAIAACTAPSDFNANIPNGSKATKEEMLTAQKAVKAFDTAVAEYIQCMKTEQVAEVSAGGDKMTDEQREKVVARYAAKIDPLFDKDKKIADQMNAEIRAWKAKNPATTKK